MKGTVFIALNQMIEDGHGLDVWLSILDEAESDGVFVGTKNYPDDSLFSIVGATCRQLDISVEEALRSFGEYLFDFLHKAHPIFATNQPDFFSFIQSIDGVIHVEVHKLDEHARTPDIKVQQVSDHEALLNYHSERKLCYLAEGLLLGASKHYGIQITIEQTQCMHDGAEQCQMRLTSSPNE